MKDERVKKLRRDLQKKAIPFHNVFSSPEGVEVLKSLKAEFDPDVLSNCSETTPIVIRAAQHDVIRYIELMIKLRGEDYG